MGAVEENTVEPTYHLVPEAERGAQRAVGQLGVAQWEFPSILITESCENKV